MTPLRPPGAPPVRPLTLALLAALAIPSAAQSLPPPMPFVHDPSTVIHTGGQYYVFTTGHGAPILTSPDSYTWTRSGSVFTQIPPSVLAAAPGNNGTDIWAPDILRLNHQFFLYYAVSAWGSFVSAIGLATNPTLDPHDPAYLWTDRGIVVQSLPGEDLNAIDPGVIHAPDGTLWLCFGSYHGTIQLIQLDPATGLRLHPSLPATVIASQSEASDIIAHNRFFYLFTNHGSCCQGKNSGYNIRVGRSKSITGPYLDKHGDDMAAGAGSLFLAAHDHRIGPGHFGRLLEDDPATAAETAPAELFSIHYEADLDQSGRPVLDIRPLLWSSDDWPIPGDHLPPGPYILRSAQSESILDLHVDLPPPPPRVRTNPQGQGSTTPTPAPPPAPFVPKPTLLRLAPYITLDDQKWLITPTTPGYSKIINLMTGDALQQSSEATITFAPYTGADTQLWQLDQLPDATYRIRNKATRLTLTAPTPKSPNTPLATPFTPDDLHKWIVTTP